MMYRQGDVLLIPAAAIPETAKKMDGRSVLAEGEATGHAHVAIGNGIEMYEDESGTLWFSAPNGGAVVHEEHGQIVLHPGSYRVVRQREYHPEEIRNVAD